jgi:hypothetical protein
VDVSRHILVLDTSVLAKSNIGRREYYNLIATSVENLYILANLEVHALFTT